MRQRRYSKRGPGPCFMGVDQGPISTSSSVRRPGRRRGRSCTWTSIRTGRSWTGLCAFHVSRCVVDALPETRNARAFARRHKGKVYLNFYNEHQKGAYAWNEADLTVSCNRTESLDASHKEITDQALILRRNARS